MKAHRQPCPCGCKRFVVPPLIYCQCGTLSEQEADELVRRWNAFEAVPGKTYAKFAVQLGRMSREMRHDVVDYVDELRAAQTTTTTFAALRAAQRLFDEVLPRFDWGRSALDANAIRLLNEVPAVVARAIKECP